MHGLSSLSQIATVLYARRKWMLLVTALVLATAIIVCLIVPPRYTATSVVVFNTRGSDAIVDKNDTLSFNSYVSGEVDLIGSRRVMQRAAADPALRDSPLTLRQQHGNQPREDWLADFLAANTTITAAKNVRTVSIATAFDDPAFAALAANTIARAYLATSLDLRVAPARQNVAFYRQQKAARTAELGTAQALLDEFLRRTGMTGMEARSDADDLQLRTLAERLGAARADQAGSAAESHVGGIDSAVAAGKISNPVVSQLRQEIAAQSASLRDLSVLSGPNYPTVVQARARLGELQGQLAAELAKVAQGVDRHNTAVTREGNAIGALEAQQRRAMSASAANRSRLAVLDGDVARAKGNYDAVAARLADVELQSSLETPNAAILSPAPVPRGPSFPNWPLIVIAALAAGVVLGAIVALAVELIVPRVRSRDDLEALLAGAPVLCDLTA